MRTLSQNIIASLTLIALISACGKKSGSSSGPSSSPDAPSESTRTESPSAEENEREEEVEPEPEEPAVVLPTDGSNIEGQYKATFITLNSNVNGTLPGSLTLRRDKESDKIYAYLRMFAGRPKAWHPQAIYTGTRCPTLADDTNKDGFIDILEAYNVVGKILIPLDADFGNQRSGRNFYPVGDLSGSYHYERITSFRRLLNDLKDEDRDPEDNVVKLKVDEPFELEGKVVMVQGVSQDIEFPPTVASLEKYRPFQTLPITCGIIRKVDLATEPGEPHVSDAIPGPIAEVRDDQDRPAPDGAGVGSWEDDNSGGTTGGTTGTNETEEGETPTYHGGSASGETSGETTGGSSDESEEEDEGGSTGGSEGQ